MEGSKGFFGNAIKSWKKISVKIKLVTLLAIVAVAAVITFGITRKMNVSADVIGTVKNQSVLSYSEFGVGKQTLSTSVSTDVLSPSLVLPVITSVVLSPSSTVKALSKITFSASYTYTSRVYIHVCKTNAISGQTCSGGSYCNSSLATSPARCTYTTKSTDAGKALTGYVFVCSSTNLCSVVKTANFNVTN